MPRHLQKTLPAFLVLALAYATAARLVPWLPGYHALYFTPGGYTELLRRQAAQREVNLTGAERIAQFRQLLPFWYGTRYGFHGQTAVPGEGRIACGYFVTTVVQHLGYACERTKLARLPSETMIQALVKPKTIRRYSGLSFPEFLEKMKRQEPGLYLVGLDTHTGFLLHQRGELRFVHASGRFPYCVVNEPAAESVVLRESRYRVTGRLLAAD
ncbi:hypothetical protein [Tellurirhabdus rosea]|uniref:hypothetical protein n=1 Tax=Tellurirhabdus rosea TaxID=2674997 RepID=UPI0022569EDE|nr:hypothetical protein [Tellurirhabdus rosea]